MKTLAMLQRWQAGQSSTEAEMADALSIELSHRDRAAAFDLTPENGRDKINQRSQVFTQVINSVGALCQNLGLKNNDLVLLTLWTLWIPFSLQLVECKQALDRPLVQGILGVQGTGKTTLTQVCGSILRTLGYSTLSFSLDDLYKTYRDRQELLKTDPRLVWRGPPGTHDIDLGIAVLDSARQIDRRDPILVPRFDKSLYHGAGDRLDPQPVTSADIILFEGWFTGVRPVNPAIFEQRIDPIITESDRAFARDSNERLRAYLPLWERLDRLAILYPSDYRLSKQWRKEAEQAMKSQGKPGMSDVEIDQFVEYFWKALHPEIFIAPLTQIPKFTDLVVEIKPDRGIGKIYRPL